MPSEFRHIDRVAFLLATTLLWVVPSLAAEHLTADQVRAAAGAAPTGKLDLSGKSLSGDNLTGLDLSGANLAGANLTGANLHGVKLVGADLTRADLSEADLTFAWIMRANFTGARLRGATMGPVRNGKDGSANFVLLTHRINPRCIGWMIWFPKQTEVRDHAAFGTGVAYREFGPLCTSGTYVQQMGATAASADPSRVRGGQ